MHYDYGLLYVSNYAGGCFTAIGIDKLTGEMTDTPAYNECYGKGSNVVPDRQGDAHVHGAWTYGSFVYVADLGSDKIWHYQVIFFLFPFSRQWGAYAIIPFIIWLRRVYLCTYYFSRNQVGVCRRMGTMLDTARHIPIAQWAILTLFGA